MKRNGRKREKTKFKFIYKCLIVFAVFIGALVFFSSGIRETVFSGAAETTEMSAATLPTISIEVAGSEINRLHGYVSNLDEMIMRESITPIKQDRSFTVLIDENESVVKKLKYEVLNEDGQEIESDSFIVLDVEDGPKKVKISLKETMKSGKEYVAKITLITNQSKRIYYYTRLKMYDDGHLAEKLEFAQDFHKTMLSGQDYEKAEYEHYLEPQKSADNSSYAYVDIHSDFSMIGWGNLEPTVIYEEVPTVNEFYDNMISMQLVSMVSVETDTGLENYIVKENFRFNYTTSRIYLYNYVRTMEAVFDVANTSLAKSEFKLGITNDSYAETLASDSREYAAFVYGRELYVYNAANNRLAKAFSFRQEGLDFARNYYDDHELHLIKVHDDGKVDFVVAGYMNRGEYEGRVGIILYRYYSSDGRIEEQLYVPISSSYELLKCDMTDFDYLSMVDVFYFSIYDSIYAFNLVTKELTVIADNVPESSMLFCPEEKYIVWQNDPDPYHSDMVSVFNLETGERRDIKAAAGENVSIFGMIDSNFIYGCAKKADAEMKLDGSILLPSYRLVIENLAGELLKTYEEDGYYISSIEVGDNILVLKRLKMKMGSPVSYTEAPNDSIMNRLVEKTYPVSVSKRITDRTLTEYYVSLPDTVEMKSVPALDTAKSTVINYDTTTRVSEPENRALKYFTYSFGEVVFSSESAAEAIKIADEKVGTVINKDGRLIWERGIKSPRAEITGIQPVNADSSHDSLQAAMKMLLEFKNNDQDTASFDKHNETVYEWLDSKMKASAVDLTGASLDEALYYVYKSRPVIAMRGDGTACVITGYDQSNITVYEPSKSRSIKYSIKEAGIMFEAVGNIFVSFVE